MDFELNEDQRMLADTVGSFAKQESPVERFRAMRDHEVGWDRDTWKKMGELGWLSVPFPEEVGGFGGSFVDVALVLEKLGTTLVPEPYLASVVLGGMAVLKAGDAEQQTRFLGPMIEGRTSLALAWAERESRYDPGPAETRAERDGATWKLTGEKTFVLNGHAADQLVVSATTPDGLALFVVDRESPGVRVQTVKTQDGHKAGLVHLEGARVEDDRMLGEPGVVPPVGAAGEPRSAAEGTRILSSVEDVLEHVVDYGAAGACAEGLGIVDTMLATTVEYLGTREQFGVKIGTFQVLQHRAVDMFVEAQVCRSMSILASLAVDVSDADQRRADVSAAKVQLSTGGGFVGRQSIQLHGGIAITDEADIGLYFKRLNVLNALFGDEDHHLRRFSRLPTFTSALG